MFFKGWLQMLSKSYYFIIFSCKHPSWNWKVLQIWSKIMFSECWRIIFRPCSGDVTCPLDSQSLAIPKWCQWSIILIPLRFLIELFPLNWYIKLISLFWWHIYRNGGHISCILPTCCAVHNTSATLSFMFNMAIKLH